MVPFVAGLLNSDKRMSDIENRFNDFLLRLNNDEMTLTKFLDDNEQREIRKNNKI